MKTFLIDAAKCIDCRNCQTACKDEHCDNDWSPIAATQSPRQYWIKIQNKEVASGSRMRQQRIPLVCQQCASAPCMHAAQDGAIYRREDGIVIIDPIKSRGQKHIVGACPYGAIYWNPELEIPQKCTMCAHLKDADREPRCVTACPTDALKTVDSKEVEDSTLLYAKVERLHPEIGTQPQVFYQNLPKPFIAGETCTPDGEACVPGVKVTARHQITGFESFDIVDAFGEFKVKGLEPGYYTVLFEKAGYTTKVLSNINAQEPVNVEEVHLYQEI